MCVAATACGKVYIVFVNGERESSQLAKLNCMQLYNLQKYRTALEPLTTR